MLLLLVAVARASPVYAQTPETREASTQRDEALLLYDRSQKAYDEGRYQDAATLLHEAYETYPEPLLLYNLGATYEKLQRPQDALSYYEKYLVEKPDAEERAATEKRIAALRDELASPSLLAGKTRRGSDGDGTGEMQPVDDEVSPWPWVVTGVGVAAIASGIILHVVAGNKNQAAIDEPTVETAREQRDSAESLNVAGNVTLIGGISVAAGGLIWGVVDVSF